MPTFTANHTGAVISTAISKYIYVLVNPKFDGRIRLSYSVTENVDTAAEIKHDIVKEALKLFQLKGIEIVSVSDIPGEGSGLGSSSAFTVGLLRALYTYSNFASTPRALAEHAFALEGGTCGHPIGRQDAYASAFGGFNYYEFKADKVKVTDFHFQADDLVKLESDLMLFWTGLRAEHTSDSILREQMATVSHGHTAEDIALLMVELTQKLKLDLDKRRFHRIGEFVHSSWVLKRKFASNVTNPEIDGVVARALHAEATGAKICGAGGGGFLLVVADPIVQDAVKREVGLRHVPVRIGVEGSKVIWREE